MAAYHANQHGVGTYDWTEVQKANQVAHIDALPGVDTYWDLRNSAGQPVVHPRNYAPISWKASLFEFVSGKAYFAGDGVGGEWPDRWFCRVVLKNLLTGQHEARVSAHMIPHGQVSPAFREARWDQGCDVFVHLMTLDGLPTIGGTDANERGFVDELRARNVKNFQVAATGATHKNGRIDYVVGCNLHKLEA